MNPIITRPVSIISAFFSGSFEEQFSILQQNALLIDDYSQHEEQYMMYYYFGYYVEVILSRKTCQAACSIVDITPYSKAHFLPSERVTSAGFTQRTLCMAA